MKTNIVEVAPDTYRISAFYPEKGIQINQYLIRDDEPFLMHAGLRKTFPISLDAVSSLIDASKLRWIGFSHFEPDECGGMNEWLKVAPHAQPTCGIVGARVMMGDFADRAAKPLSDGEVLEIGGHRLRYLSTPHVPHGWDAGLFFDETEHTLLCSDLFFHPGDAPAVVRSDIVGPAAESVRASMAGPMAHDMPYTPRTESTLRKLAALRPQTLALMHGSTFKGDGEKALIELAVVIRQTLGRPEGTQ
jgi:flavorubredoxin